jgi:hypothetical protein
LLFGRFGALGRRWVANGAVGSLGWRRRIGESADRDSCIDFVAGGLVLSFLLYIRGGAKAGVAPGLNVVV